MKLEKIANYYTDKISKFGTTPKGVDWNNSDVQYLRFAQLLKLIDTDKKFSLNDLGCGYGALADFIHANITTNFLYRGFDISEAMIDAAIQKNVHTPNVSFKLAQQPDIVSDYSVASGIFNVRQDIPDKEWEQHISDTVHLLDEYSIRGFAFNCLTEYSDADKLKNYLYYANPLAMFDYCKKVFSNNVALLHDYNLYEFTILVRK